MVPLEEKRDALTRNTTLCRPLPSEKRTPEKVFEHFYMKAKARMSYMCHVRSTADSLKWLFALSECPDESRFL